MEVHHTLGRAGRTRVCPHIVRNWKPTFLGSSALSCHVKVCTSIPARVR